jgi:AsmA family protein
MPKQGLRTDHRRRLLRVAAALAVAGMATAFLDWNLLRRPIEHVVSRKLERDFRINGPLSIQLWSRHPGLSADGIELANVPHGKAAHLAKVGKLKITLDLAALLKGEWVFNEIDVTEADIQLEENSAGEGNWILGKQTGSEPIPLRLGTIRIRNSALALALPSRKIDVRVNIASEETTGHLLFTASGHWQGEAMDISGKAGTVQGFANGAQPYPVDARGNIGATRFSVNGSAAELPRMDGLDIRFTLSGRSLANLFPLTGIPLPATPPYRIAGRLVHAGQSWQFSDLDGLVGSSDMRGTFGVDRSTTPQRLEGALHSKRLDLTDLSGFIGARSASGQQIAPRAGKVLPSRPLGFDKIAAANVDIQFTIDDFRNTGLPLDSAQGRLHILDRRVTLAPLKVGLARGSVDGRLELDTRKLPASASLNMRATRLHLRDLMPGSDSRDFTSGVLGGHASLTMRGQSVAELLGSADGNIALAMTGGSTNRLLVRLANLDFANALITWLSGGQKEDIRCLIGDMEAVNGVLKPRTLLLDTTRTRVRGTGQISLRDELLDLHLRTEAKDTSLLALRGPLYLGGSFANPVVRPEPIPLGSRIAGAVALGLIAPPLALLPLIETGGAEDTPCSAAVKPHSQKPSKR